MRHRAWPLVPLLFLLALSTAAARAQGPDLARGRATYKELCAKCHGASGKGDGKESATLKTKPKDLGDCQRMLKFTDLDLFRAIKDGGPALGLSDDMHAYSEALEDGEIHEVVAFVRTLCPR